jgi:uncharacterized surface protein with fasciclin (FAS1) repeats
MYPTKNIVENAMNSNDHSTLVAAAKAAGLMETIEGPGPFTVFALNERSFQQTACRHSRHSGQRGK